jgi:hypothetical protein
MYTEFYSMYLTYILYNVFRLTDVDRKNIYKSEIERLWRQWPWQVWVMKALIQIKTVGLW